MTVTGGAEAFEGLTAVEFAKRTRLDPRFAEALLEDERARGHLERIEGRYRFTRDGWETVGRPLAAVPSGAGDEMTSRTDRSSDLQPKGAIVNLTRNRPGVDRAQASATRNYLVVHTGVRVSFDRLNDADRERLVELAKKLEKPSGGLDWRQLSTRERKRLEALLEKGAGWEAGTFEAKRKDADAIRKLKALGAENRRRNPLTRRQQTDFFATMHAELKSGHFFVGHVALLTYLVAQFQAGEALGMMHSIEGQGAGAVLVFDVRWGLLGAISGGEDDLVNWRFLLEHLVTFKWLTLAKQGPRWTVALGERTLAALGESK